MRLFRYLRRSRASLRAGVGGPLIHAVVGPRWWGCLRQLVQEILQPDRSSAPRQNQEYAGFRIVEGYRSIRVKSWREIGKSLPQNSNNFIDLFFGGHGHGRSIQDAPQKRRGPFPLAFAGGKTK